MPEPLFCGDELPQSGTSRASARLAVAVRDARPEDVPALYVLQKAAMCQYALRSGLDPATAPLESLAETEEDVAAAVNHGGVLIACSPQEPHRPLATLRLTVDRHDAGMVWLTRFAVDPEQQARGVGRRLYGAAVDWARAAGAGRICLHTALANSETTAFYGSLGFQLLETSNTRGYRRGLFCHQFPDSAAP